MQEILAKTAFRWVLTSGVHRVQLCVFRRCMCVDVSVLLQGALVMPLMSTGFSMGLVKFNLITARKP